MIRKSMKWSYVEGLLASFMVGSFEAYMIAFAVFSGFEATEVGMLGVVPLLLGAILQLSTPLGLGRTRSLKSWVIGMAWLQSFAVLGFGFLSYFEIKTRFLFFALSTIYFASKYSVATGWSSWMGYLLPKEVAHGFFSKRNQFQYIGLLVGTLSAGYMLKQGSGFPVVFAGAAFCRWLSVFALSKKSYQPIWDHPSSDALKKLYIQISNQWSFKKASSSGGAQKHWVLLFTFWFFSAVHLSAPYVAPFMLKELKMTSDLYAGAVGIFILGKVLGAWLSPNCVKRFSLAQILWWSGLGLAPLPMIWYFSADYSWILLVQFLSGLAWGLYEVALNLIFFATMDSRQRVPMVTMYNFFESLAIFTGGVLGAEILSEFHVYTLPYAWLFVLGGGLRLVVLAFYVDYARSPKLSHHMKSFLEKKAS